jgi:hypothetical protein
MSIKPSYSSGYRKTGKKKWLIRIPQNLNFLKNNPKKNGKRREDEEKRRKGDFHFK